MRPSLLLSVVQLVIVSIVLQVTAYNEGDVQLVYNGGPTFEGVLQVYSQSKWNTVCYESSNYDDSVTNREAAAAVCRQLGYSTVHRWGSAASFDYSLSEYPSSSFSGIRCPTVKDVTEGEVYLMRCDIGHLIESKDCQSIVGIRCETTSYDGQIRFLPIIDEGVLQINFEGQWRPICVDSFNFKKTVANSACRQMGYTNASLYYPVHISNNGMAWKINDLSNCHSINSFPCFTNCMVQSAGYTSVDQCDGIGIQFKLTCQFIKSDQALQSSGNQRICQYSSSESTIDVRIFSSVTGVLSVGMVILLVVVIVQCCRRRRPANPQQAAQPNPVVRWWRDRGGNEYGAVHEQREN